MNENESDEKWEYGVHHVYSDGWTNVRAHNSERSARNDLSTCGMNCTLVRRHKDGPWEPLTSAEVSGNE